MKYILYLLLLFLTSCAPPAPEGTAVYGEDFAVLHNQTLFGATGDFFALVCATDHVVIDHIRTLPTARIRVHGHGEDVTLQISKVKNAVYLIEWESGLYAFAPGRAYVVEVK